MTDYEQFKDLIDFETTTQKLAVEMAFSWFSSLTETSKSSISQYDFIALSGLIYAFRELDIDDESLTSSYATQPDAEKPEDAAADGAASRPGSASASSPEHPTDQAKPSTGTGFRVPD